MGGPGTIIDITQFAEQHGMYTLLLLLLTIGFGYLSLHLVKWVLSRAFKKSKERLDALEKNILQIQAATTILTSLGEQERAAFLVCVDSLDKIASEDHWKNCPLERCPNLVTILTRQNELMEELQDLIREFRDHRTQIQEAMRDLFKAVRDVGLETIALWRRWRNGGN